MLKKIFIITLLFVFNQVLFAQSKVIVKPERKSEAKTEKTAEAKQKTVVEVEKEEKEVKAASKAVKRTEKAYTMFGIGASFFYFINSKDSSQNLSLKFKTPLGRGQGVEIGIHHVSFPITSYSLGSASYSGFGTEEYTNFSFSYLIYMPFYRYFQFKVGIDYYNFTKGEIADSPSGANGGTLYSEQSNTQKNHFGAHAGVNLDIYLYKNFYIMTYFGYRYILSEHDSATSGFGEFSVALGYRLR